MRLLGAKKLRSLCKYVATLVLHVLCFFGVLAFKQVDACVGVFHGFPEKSHERRVGNVLDAVVLDYQLREARFNFLCLETNAWRVVGPVLEGRAFDGSQRRADLWYVFEGILEALVRHTKYRV